MTMPESIKIHLRPLKRFLFSVLYLSYDAYRFLKHSGIFKRSPDGGIDYKVTKEYHRLEKSLIFKNRKQGAGWMAVHSLLKLLEKSDFKTVQQKSALKVLKEFHDESFDASDNGLMLRSFLARHSAHLNKDCVGGALTLNASDVLKGRLNNPEVFFGSRRSIRAFKKGGIDKSVMERALGLASNTPSVCNRQSWKVFHLSGRKNIDDALSLQNGNRGFSEEINDLLVVATDLISFDSEIERFQQWVDGGIYAMSLVYALHSLGVASCFLNLSLPPAKDIQLRKLLRAPDEYAFITMIAIGYPEEEFKVCASSRTPHKDYYFRLE